MNLIDRERRGPTIGIVLLAVVLMVLLYNCHGDPPVELPWESSDSFTVKTVSTDYDVSRFWACGWAGGCPLKQWRYCLKITPKEPLAALLWHSRTSRAHLETSNELMDRSSPLNWNVNVPSGLESRIARARQNGRPHDWETKLLQDIRRIQQNDRAAIDDIMAKTREGIFFTASYQIMGDNPRPTTWSIYPGCNGRAAIRSD